MVLLGNYTTGAWDTSIKSSGKVYLDTMDPWALMGIRQTLRGMLDLKYVPPIVPSEQSSKGALTSLVTQATLVGNNQYQERDVHRNVSSPLWVELVFPGDRPDGDYGLNDRETSQPIEYDEDLAKLVIAVPQMISDE